MLMCEHSIHNGSTNLLEYLRNVQISKLADVQMLMCEILKENRIATY